MPPAWTTSYVASNDKNPTRAAQLNFLRALWQGGLTLPEVLHQSNISRRRLCYWLNNRWFRNQLNTVRQRLRKLKALELEVLSCVAPVKLSDSLKEKSPKPANRKMLEQINSETTKLDRAQQKIKASKPRGRRHPDVPKDESEALMQAMQTASE